MYMEQHELNTMECLVDNQWGDSMNKKMKMKKVDSLSDEI